MSTAKLASLLGKAVELSIIYNANVTDEYAQLVQFWGPTASSTEFNVPPEGLVFRFDPRDPEFDDLNVKRAKALVEHLEKLRSEQFKSQHSG